MNLSGKIDNNFETLHKLILKSCERNSETIALIGDGGNGEKIRYRRLAEIVPKIAGSLHSLGFGKNDRIGIIGENCPGWSIVYLSILAAGATVVPVDPAMKENELVKFFRTASLKALFCSRKLYDSVKNIILLNGFEIELYVLEQKDSQGLNRFIGDKLYLEDNINSDDTAVIIFTSGTTGDPKAVNLTHRNLISNIKSIIKSKICSEYERFLSILPLFHTFEATVGFLYCLSSGYTIIYARALTSKYLLEDIKNNDITVFLAVPLLYEKIYNAILRKLNSAPFIKRNLFKTLYSISRLNKNLGVKLFKSFRKQAGLGTITRFISGGAPLSPQIAEWFNTIGIKLLQGYGLTECSPVVSVNRPKDVRYSSIGSPLPGVDVKIVNPTSDGIGEIVVRGANVTPGYINNPEATLELIRDGWLYTGDLGKIENGHIYITGRKKNLIVSGGGKNIYPEEIETELDLSGLIMESIVYGKTKSGKTGESICAIIVPDMEVLESIENGRPGAKRIRELIKIEVDMVNSRLSDYKRIESFEIRLEEFEKTSTRKIKRRLYV
ncbi:MAG: AMP-binding protein [Candidatus Zixiibacteriota bacterium]